MFDSTCIITRPDPAADPVWDDAINDYVTPTVDVYAGACGLHTTDMTLRTVEAGQVTVGLARRDLDLPPTVDVRNDDDVEIVTSPDPLVAGLKARVADVPHDDWTATRSVVIEERT